MFRRCWLFIVVILLALNLRAFAIDNLNFTGFIADEANVLSENVIQDLNMTLWDLQKKSGADIAVVTLPSLDGRSVADVAIDIGRSYKIGSKEKNNGVVFLTAINERKMRIEIGTGLEGKINISQLTEIRDNDILPYYRQSDYEGGIARGTYKLADLVAEAEGVSIHRQGTCPSKASSSGSCPSSRERAPWWVYLIAAIIAPFSGRRRRGMGSFGGFGGFGGGGGFGGSGCSGGW